MRNTLTIELFIERSNKIHNFKYDYSESVYKTCNDKIDIICPIHGKFSQYVMNHLKGAGCSKCRYVDKSIRNRIPKIGKSFGDLFSELITEWSNKNIKTPFEYKPYSNDSVFWVCKECNHEWSTSLCNRAKHKSNCPLCFGNHDVKDSNRLTNTYKEISEEWDYTKNSDKPEDYCYGSHKKKWWTCKECQFSFEKKICDRTILNTGCRKCSRSRSEIKIINILTENNIKFKQQFTFDNCKYKNKLYFDFAIWIDEKLKLIEFNGEQHYQVVEYWGGISGLKTRQNRDKIKLEYCQSEKIPLLIIQYGQVEQISELILGFIKD